MNLKKLTAMLLPKGIFGKKKEKKPKKMTRESEAMLYLLLISQNERVPKYCFYDVGVHNPGRAKSALVNKRGKTIICKKSGRGVNYKASWMIITNPFDARRNMSELEREKYPIADLYMGGGVYNQQCK